MLLLNPARHVLFYQFIPENKILLKYFYYRSSISMAGFQSFNFNFKQPNLQEPQQIGNHKFAVAKCHKNLKIWEKRQKKKHITLRVTLCATSIESKSFLIC